MDITEPLVLAEGSHRAGSGYGCAMNVISWELGQETISDYPPTVQRALALLVQWTNDALAEFGGVRDGNVKVVPAKFSARLLEIAHETIGTTEEHDTCVLSLTDCVESLGYDFSAPPAKFGAPPQLFEQYNIWLNDFRGLLSTVAINRVRPDSLYDRVYDREARLLLDRLEYTVRKARVNLGLPPKALTAPDLATVNDALRKMSQKA